MAPNDTVMVQYEGLLSASSGFQTSAGKLENTISDLDGRLNSLLALFTGNAATKFRAHHHNLDVGMGDMRAVIARLGVVLSEAQAAYAHADNSAANLFT